jgi:hypothetical protein
MVSENSSKLLTVVSSNRRERGHVEAEEQKIRRWA